MNKILHSIFLIFTFIPVMQSEAANPTTVPTFHCLSIYWSPSQGAVDNECQVRYCVSGSGQWKDALALWFDDRDGEYRGSIVNLTSGTLYEIQLTLQGTGTTETFYASTWGEDFPIGNTVILPENSNQTLVINQAGTSRGYILYTHADGKTATIDVANSKNACIEINSGAAYVIIRGLILKGASGYAIRFRGNVHDVVIEECDISGWGNENAITAHSGDKVERIIVQRNKIHHPRTDTNSWDTGHPQGPQGIGFRDSKGNHVIRYNEIYSNFEHYYNDPIGSGSNFSFEGFPNRDSDIYGNYVAHCWDDGIEAEGANMNVRIWGNYIEHTYVKIAIAATSKGPIYIWRNVAGAARRSKSTDISDDYDRGDFIKAGGETRSNIWYGSGRTYVFHNTILQPDPPQGQIYRLGCKNLIGAGGGPIYELKGRNNIGTHYDEGTVYRDKTNSCTNDMDYDIYNGTYKHNCASRPHESHGIRVYGFPEFDPNNIEFSQSTGIGEFALKPGSPGIDAGEVIPNFNDGYLGSAPDVGAFEAGTPPMEFGVNAYIDVTPKYTLSVNVQGSGCVTMNPCYSVYREGTVVTLTAMPDLGWVLDRWTGDFNGTENPMTMTTVDSAMTVTAVFIELTAGKYELRVNTSGSGSVTVDPPGNIYYEGTVVTLTAVPDSGWAFSDWKGDWNGSNNPEPITMDSHKSISASFVPLKYYNLSVDIIGSGNVILDPCGTTFVEETEVTLTAIPDSGCIFDCWNGDLSGSNNPKKLILDSPKQVTANFIVEGGEAIYLIPTDDSYVRGDMYADRNYNSASYLRVKHGIDEKFYRHAYLKFDLSSINGPIFDAMLKLTVKKKGLIYGSPARVDIYSVKDDNWIESTITWNNAPAVNEHLDSVTDIETEGKVYMWDVTSFVHFEIVGDKVVSLMLKDNGAVDKQVDFCSRESVYSPVLTVIQAAIDVAEFQKETPILRTYQLYQNYPNPFNSCTRICYYLPKSGKVKLVIYDVRGRGVSVLVNCMQDAGTHDFIWETNGNELASGIYLCCLQVNSFTKTMKMLLMQ